MTVWVARVAAELAQSRGSFCRARSRGQRRAGSEPVLLQLVDELVECSFQNDIDVASWQLVFQQVLGGLQLLDQGLASGQLQLVVLWRQRFELRCGGGAGRETGSTDDCRSSGLLI